MANMEKTGYWAVAFRAFIFFSINLLILAASLYWWRLGMAASEPGIVLNPAHEPFYNPEMPVRLFYYVLATFFVGISLLWSLVLSLYFCNSRFSRYSFLRNFLLLGLGLLLSFVVPSVWIAVFPLLMFAGFLLVPRYVGLVPAGKGDGPLEQYYRKLRLWVGQIADRYAMLEESKALIGLCVERCPRLKNLNRYCNIQLVGIVVWLGACLALILFAGPKIWETHRLLNPYYRVPNTYIFHTNFGQLKIDPTDLINGTNMFGAHGKIDVRNIDAWKDNPTCVEVAADDSILQNFVDSVNAAAYPERGTFFKLMPQRNRCFLFYGEGRLCVIPADNLEHSQTSFHKRNASLLHKLEALTGKDFSGVAAALEKPTYYDTLDFATLQKINPFTRRAADSYQVQTFFETAWQVMFLGDLRHQAYYILPLHEYVNGKPLDKIHHFYGVGYTIIGGLLNKIFTEGGQINWGGTVRCIATVTLITLLMMSLTMWNIFRDFRIVSVCALIYLLKNVGLGAEVYIMNFGHVDLRIIFYFPTLYVFYLYTQKACLRYGISLLVLSGLSVCFFFEFGVATLLACSGSLVVLCITEKRLRPIDIFILMTQAILLAVGYYVSQIGNKEVASYFLQGVMAGILDRREVFLLGMIFAVYMLLFIYMYMHNSKYSILFVYTAFSAQIIAVYYIWHASPDHYSGYMHIHMLPLIIFGYFFLVEQGKEKILQNVAYLVIVLMLVINCDTLYRNFKYRINQYKVNFSIEENYKWKKMNTNFYSTVNPEYFENAVDLINRYVPQGKKDIFLLSQYDQFLLFLSKKYTNMPVYDIYGYLLTPKENENVVNLIRKTGPEYLFVDSDITSPYMFDLVPYGPLYGDFYYKMSLFRALSLEELSNVFQNVRHDYELVERSELISVYKRCDKEL